ncbi:MAG TPA: DMT family transporter [Pseudomonadales bacterium]|nr:DMT family transporter [Pseudomonadales bacterium]
MQKINVRRGAFYLAMAACCYAVTGVLVRLTAGQLDNNALVFWRNMVGLVSLVPWLLHTWQRKNGFSVLRTDMMRWHIARTAVGLTAMYLYFYSLAHFALADAMLFVYSAPVIVPLLAHWFLHEPITTKIYAVVLLGLAGVALVLKPGGALFYWMAPVGLSCTVFTAFAFVFVRKLSVSEPPMCVVFYFTSFSALVSLLPFLFHPQWPTAHSWLLLAGIGGVNTLAQWFLSLAYGSAPAARIAPVSYLTVLLAALLGWVFWDEVPDHYAIGGAVLIFASALLVMRQGLVSTAQDAPVSQ